MKKNGNGADRKAGRAGDALARNRNVKESIMTLCAFDGTIGRAVEKYTGRALVELDIVADPNVRGAFAVRAVVAGQRPDDDYSWLIEEFFLVRTPLQHVTAEDLEEVKFTQWSPRVRS